MNDKNIEKSGMKKGEYSMKKKFVLFAISVLIIAISGCVDKGAEQVSAPNPTEPSVGTTTPTISVTGSGTEVITPTITVTGTVTPTVTTTEPTTIATPEPEVQVYSVRKSVNDSDTRMTLNSIRYAQIIDDKKMADPGKQYLIIDITIENIGKDKNLSYSGDQFVILDSDEAIEISYGEDVSSLELEKHFNGDNISPGEKRQGELSFQVPEGTKGLLLKFEYSPESSGGSQSEFFMLDQ